MRPRIHLFLMPFVLVLAAPWESRAQTGPSCRFICEVEWLVEPTFTIENLGNRHRIVKAGGITERVGRERLFETVLAVDMGTKIPRLGFTAEAIAAPFSDDNEVELEFEANLHWLTEEVLGGWLTSHFDIVDQFSPAERPGDTRAYTHKLDFEWDTAFQVFSRLPEGKWLRNVEAEVSLDYLATGLPKAGDVIGEDRFIDRASPWSLSFVMVIPLAPLEP